MDPSKPKEAFKLLKDGLDLLLSIRRYHDETHLETYNDFVLDVILSLTDRAFTPLEELEETYKDAKKQDLKFTDDEWSQFEESFNEKFAFGVGGMDIALQVFSFIKGWLLEFCSGKLTVFAAQSVVTIVTRTESQAERLCRLMQAHRGEISDRMYSDPAPFSDFLNTITSWRFWKAFPVCARSWLRASMLTPV